MKAQSAAKLATTTVMTMAAGPMSLDHHTHGTSSYDEAVIDANAKQDEGLRINGANGPVRGDSADVEGEDSDEVADADGDEEEEEEKEDEQSADIAKPNSRKAPGKQSEDAVMEGEEESEESSAAEGAEDSDESDSDSGSEDAQSYDAVSEAAETAASAEVQTRNNCM